MAEALCHVEIVSRGGEKGGSAVERAAYMSGRALTSTYDGQTYDHSDKAQEVIYAEILTPPNAPEWACDLLTLANAIEHAEARKDAQLVRSVYVTLPQELTQAQNIELARDYAHIFVEEGMIAMVSMHDKHDGNPHAHLLLPMRPLNPDGTWAAKSHEVYLLDKQGQRIKLPNGRYKTRKEYTTDWNNRGNVEKWRMLYQAVTNTHLKMAGLKVHIDVRNYARQGIDKIPTLRLPQADYSLEQQGIPTERGAINEQICAENQRRAEIDRQIAQFTQKMQPKKRKRWKCPEREALKQRWSELRAKESERHDSRMHTGFCLVATL